MFLNLYRKATCNPRVGSNSTPDYGALKRLAKRDIIERERVVSLMGGQCRGSGHLCCWKERVLDRVGGTEVDTVVSSVWKCTCLT